MNEPKDRKSFQVWAGIVAGGENREFIRRHVAAIARFDPRAAEILQAAHECWWCLEDHLRNRLEPKEP